MPELPGSSKLVFACEGGFEAAVGASTLGLFDGRDRRELHSYAISSRREQLLVSMHEHLHHELHWSTGWGVLAAMAGLLADEGVDPDRLQTLARSANQGCRRVHEIFATTISAGVLGVEESRTLLGQNQTYTDYLDQGLALGGPPTWPWQFRESAIQMLLRTLMQPAVLIELAELGFERLTAADIRDRRFHPDVRLSAVAAAAPLWWDEVFASTLALHPERGGDHGGRWARQLPDDQQAMEALKAWEETVLIPALQEVAESRLRSLGYTVLSGEEYLDVVGTLAHSFQNLGPDDWNVEILTERRTMTAEPLGAEREEVILHREQRVAELVSAEEFAASASDYLLDSDVFGKHVLVLFARREVIRRQFRGFESVAAGPPLLAVVGEPRQVNDNVVVPLGVINDTVGPQQLTNMFASLPVLTLTTLSTTREEANREAVLALDEVFVLIDLPLRLQVAAWLEMGTVRFRVISVEGDRPLNLTVFKVDGLETCWFLSYRSDAGFGELAQLLDRHPDRLLPSLHVPDQAHAALRAVTSHLLAIWSRFSEAEA